MTDIQKARLIHYAKLRGFSTLTGLKLEGAHRKPVEHFLAGKVETCARCEGDGYVTDGARLRKCPSCRSAGQVLSPKDRAALRAFVRKHYPDAVAVREKQQKETPRPREFHHLPVQYYGSEPLPPGVPKGVPPSARLVGTVIWNDVAVKRYRVSLSTTRRHYVLWEESLNTDFGDMSKWEPKILGVYRATAKLDEQQLAAWLRRYIAEMSIGDPEWIVFDTAFSFGPPLTYEVKKEGLLTTEALRSAIDGGIADLGRRVVNESP